MAASIQESSRDVRVQGSSLKKEGLQAIFTSGDLKIFPKPHLVKEMGIVKIQDLFPRPALLPNAFFTYLIVFSV